MNFEHDSWARFGGKKIVFGERLIFLPMPGNPENIAPRIAVGIELADGSVVFVGGRTFADLNEVLTAAHRMGQVAVN